MQGKDRLREAAGLDRLPGSCALRRGVDHREDQEQHDQVWAQSLHEYGLEIHLNQPANQDSTDDQIGIQPSNPFSLPASFHPAPLLFPLKFEGFQRLEFQSLKRWILV